MARLFRSGNEAVYEVIYDRYWQLLFRFSRKLLQDEAAAQDVVQEVFTIFWLKKGDFDVKTPLAAHLYTLTKNKILDIVKHTKVETRYLEHLQQVMQFGESMPDQVYIEKELYDQIEREIQNLPEKMRIIFEMSRKQYKTNQQIADELGISQQTVKNQVSNAIRALKGKFGDSLNTFLIFF
ncbi:RNA polymerase sigma-70 factor (ECF subfamily) [Pedobacter sp. AK017]|uniref:RNA polymerase sigma factor n=1 Tax=Pedobacter sp. AK017 TaxID=2723073 RepID=UPI0016195D4B|nr:RNA polymerase sigma-70 factor [Pedobacter sp. AK017]MBB5441318.1 RNA polymerase sigma-70 factor (ECF subfamily) [Pedobacter sp. AK017]